MTLQFPPTKARSIASTMTTLYESPMTDNKILTFATTLHVRVPEENLGEKDRSDIIHGDRICTINDLISNVVIRIKE